LTQRILDDTVAAVTENEVTAIMKSLKAMNWRARPCLYRERRNARVVVERDSRWRCSLRAGVALSGRDGQMG